MESPERDPKAFSSLRELNKWLGLVPDKPQPGLKHFTMKARQVVLLHLQGLPAREIADITNSSTGYVRRVLASEVSLQAIDDFLKFQDQEFKVLYTLSINAIRDALKSADIEVRLKAAQMYMKAHGKDGKSSYVSDTAEDVIRRIFELKVTEERPVSTVPRVSQLKKIKG